MTKNQALKAFRSLVEFENTVEGDEEDPGWNEPRLNVRLDAASEEGRSDGTYGQVTRLWRIRVTFSKSAWLPGTTADAFRDILAIADEADASVAFQNDGLELG